MTIPVTTSIRSRLTADEDMLRDALLECMATLGSAAFADAEASLGWPPERVATAVESLTAKKLVVEDGHGRVKYAYPVSGVASNHVVTLADGRRLHAMCAIDALGCYFAFRQPLHIEATCHLCGEPIAVTVAGESKVVSQPPGAYAVHVDLSKYDDWASKT